MGGFCIWNITEYLSIPRLTTRWRVDLHKENQIHLLVQLQRIDCITLICIFLFQQESLPKLYQGFFLHFTAREECTTGRDRCSTAQACRPDSQCKLYRWQHGHRFKSITRATVQSSFWPGEFCNNRSSQDRLACLLMTYPFIGGTSSQTWGWASLSLQICSSDTMCKSSDRQVVHLSIYEKNTFLKDVELLKHHSWTETVELLVIDLQTRHVVRRKKSQQAIIRVSTSAKYSKFNIRFLRCTSTRLCVRTILSDISTKTIKNSQKDELRPAKTFK